jgi:hypothetical protein
VFQSRYVGRSFRVRLEGLGVRVEAPQRLPAEMAALLAYRGMDYGAREEV